MDWQSGFDINASVEKAQTPVASWYTQQNFFERERDLVFTDSWQPVGTTALLKSPGDYFSGQFMGKPYVVVHDKVGDLRAFYNVCRHHAAELVSGQGCIKSFACPYHGWNYSLQGELMAAPRTQGIENFDKAEFALRPIPLVTTGPFIWLGFGDLGESPAVRFNDIWSRLADTQFDSLHFHSRRSYEIQCNWKVYVDNYLDGGYHVGVLHKQLTTQLQMNDYRTEVAEDYSIQSCAGIKNDRIGKEAIYAWLFPNFMINRYGPVMDTNWVIPLDAHRCLTVFDFFFAEVDGEPAQKFIEESLTISERVQQEDMQISESVQRGLNSGAYVAGRYAPKVEHAMHSFHRRLARQLFTPPA